MYNTERNSDLFMRTQKGSIVQLAEDKTTHISFDHILRQKECVLPNLKIFENCFDEKYKCELRPKQLAGASDIINLECNEPMNVPLLSGSDAISMTQIAQTNLSSSTVAFLSESEHCLGGTRKMSASSAFAAVVKSPYSGPKSPYLDICL